MKMGIKEIDKKYSEELDKLLARWTYALEQEYLKKTKKKYDSWFKRIGTLVYNIRRLIGVVEEYLANEESVSFVLEEVLRIIEEKEKK